VSTPAGSEPVAEADDETHASLLRGLADATQGRVSRRDELLDDDARP
jgi:hypothetical protein